MTWTRLTAVLLIVTSAIAGGALPAMGELGTQPAQLAIEQPDYISEDVTQSKVNGTHVYTVHTGEVDINPQNFNSSQVVGYGVEENAGRLTFDDRMGVFQFNSQGNEGTFTLYWEVREKRTVEDGNNTSVETVRTRYSAIIKVSSNATYQHIPAGDLDQQREDAANWSAFESELKNIAGSEVDVEEKTQLALDMLNLRLNPLSALSGNFTGILLALFITLSGLLVLALFGGFHLVTRLSDIKYRNRTESLKAEEDEINEKLAELNLREKKQALQNMDWNDIFDDDYRARAFRDALGETVFDGAVRLQTLVLPEHIIHDRLQAMSQAGYVGVVDREDVATDGGDGDGQPAITNAELASEDNVDEDAETVDLSQPSDEFIHALDWSDTELRSFDLPNADVDPDELVTKSRPMDLEELMEELEVQRQDFDTPEEFGEYLAEFIQSVRSHDYTDDDGSPNELRYTLNTFLQLAQIMRDRQGVPLFDLLGDAVERALVDHDPVKDAEETVKDVEAGKYA